MIVSPIVVNQLQLQINYPNIDFLEWKYYNNGLKDIYAELNYILKSIDLKRLYNDKRLKKNNDYKLNGYFYNKSLEQYYWYLLHIDNVFIYNKYLDKLIKLHKQNIEYTNIIENEVNTKLNTTKKTVNKKAKPKNQYYKETKVDMFTGNERYTYYNPVTKDEFESDNPDLLDELNSKPKKSKTKNEGVPLSHMTYSFNINKH